MSNEKLDLAAIEERANGQYPLPWGEIKADYRALLAEIKRLRAESDEWDKASLVELIKIFEVSEWGSADFMCPPKPDERESNP